MDLPFILLKSFSDKLQSRGQTLVEALLSLFILLSFFYLLQKLYKESDKSIQKARLSSSWSYQQAPSYQTQQESLYIKA